MSGSRAILIGLGLLNAVDHPSYGVGVDGGGPGRSVGRIAGYGNDLGIPTREGVGVLSIGGLSRIGMSGSRTVGIGLSGLNAVDHPSDGVSVGGVGNGDGDVALDGAGDDSLRSGVALDDGARYAVLIAHVVLIGVGGSGGGAVGIDVVDGQHGLLSRSEVELAGDLGDAALFIGNAAVIGGAAGGVNYRIVGLADYEVHGQIVAVLIVEDALGGRRGNFLPGEGEAYERAARIYAVMVAGAEVEADVVIHVAGCKAVSAV